MTTRRTAKEWADLLVDNVSTATQNFFTHVLPHELPHVEEWRLNAEKLFEILCVEIERLRTTDERMRKQLNAEQKARRKKR